MSAKLRLEVQAVVSIKQLSKNVIIIISPNRRFRKTLNANFIKFVNYDIILCKLIYVNYVN